VSANDAGTPVVVLHDLLLGQVHHGLEEIVVDPHLVIESIHGQDLFDRIETVVTKIATDQRRVLLLDARIVVLVIGTASRQDDVSYPMAPEPQQVTVEELGWRAQLSHYPGESPERGTEGEPGR